LPTAANSYDAHAAIAITVSHISHLVSVIVLYFLALAVDCSPDVASVAAILHILSPAGIFLSAPYAEASFSMMNFFGMLCYVLALRRYHLGQCGDMKTFLYHVCAGFCFGISTWFRSNGILSGVLFLHELLLETYRIICIESAHRQFRYAVSLVAGGCLIIIGMATPQLHAYRQYCSPTVFRPWCAWTIPSVYAWVQEKYW
jgi:GPI mannosyltransferase 2